MIQHVVLRNLKRMRLAAVRRRVMICCTYIYIYIHVRVFCLQASKGGKHTWVHTERVAKKGWMERCRKLAFAIKEYEAGTMTAEELVVHADYYIGWQERRYSIDIYVYRQSIML